mmetsp:Transcript_18098/g.63592  ORF Transcript_18098/g.63592 Transcript_18098/m.63592 type:complete len:339 (+) Transcript_18098:2576-3592(+)
MCRAARSARSFCANCRRCRRPRQCEEMKVAASSRISSFEGPVATGTSAYDEAYPACCGGSGAESRRSVKKVPKVSPTPVVPPPPPPPPLASRQRSAGCSPGSGGGAGSAGSASTVTEAPEGANGGRARADIAPALAACMCLPPDRKCSGRLRERLSYGAELSSFTASRSSAGAISLRACFSIWSYRGAGRCSITGMPRSSAGVRSAAAGMKPRYVRLSNPLSMSRSVRCGGSDNGSNRFALGSPRLASVVFDLCRAPRLGARSGRFRLIGPPSAAPTLSARACWMTFAAGEAGSGRCSGGCDAPPRCLAGDCCLACAAAVAAMLPGAAWLAAAKKSLA